MERKRERSGTDQGAITVFLAITFLFIMAFLGTLIDGARIAAAHAQIYHAADLAAGSALAGFDSELKDRYGLFAYRTDPDDIFEYVVKRNLQTALGDDKSASEALYQEIYNALFDDVLNDTPFNMFHMGNIKASSFSTSDHLLNANEFERQVFEYVKFRGPMELLVNNMSLDIADVQTELEKARNEEDADEAMLKLEDAAADLLELKYEYNQDLKKLKEEIRKADEEYLKPIYEQLAAEGPTRDGLKELADKMGTLNGKLPDTDKCAKLLEQLEQLERDGAKLQTDAEAMEKRFAGGTETGSFDNKPISPEMLQAYRNDLQQIKKDAQIVFAAGGTAATERAKLQNIASRVDTASEKLPVLIKQAKDAAKAEDDEDEEGSSSERAVKEAWEAVEGHFDGGVHRGANGYVSQGAALQEFSRDTGAADPNYKSKYKAEVDKANKLSDDDKRNYKKALSAGDLAGAGGDGENNDKKKVSLTAQDWDGKKLDDAKKDRQKNKDSYNDVADRFSIGDFTMTTLDNAMLGLYALGNFENTLCWNVDHNASGADPGCKQYTTNMRGNTIRSYLDDCEVEYLIKGNLEEKKNYQSLRTELTAIYTILNYSGIRRAPNVRRTVGAIASAAEAATAAFGVGRIAYYAVREGLYISFAAMQTHKDLEKLYLGKKAALFKSQDRHFDGVPSAFTQVSSGDGGGSLSIGYVDYLFVRMITTNHDKLVKRLQDLVQVNMRTQISEGFKLEKCKTTAAVEASAHVPFLFINVMFAAENSDAEGMTITKRVSQKY